jgi:drug/metabolite transporter (DMT)-like permease
MFSASALAPSSHHAREQRALLLLWIAPALWTVNYLVARTAPGIVEPHVLALARWALAGVFHVVVKGQWLRLSQVQWVSGDGWIVAAMVAWAGYALLQKKWSSPLSSTARLAAICLGGVIMLAPFALWEWQQADRPAWSPAATGLVLAAGLVPGLCAYWAYGFAQKVLGASRVAASLYLGPLYGGLTAWGVLGEPMGWHHLGGACLILPGIWLASQKSRGV